MRSDSQPEDNRAIASIIREGMILGERTGPHAAKFEILPNQIVFSGHMKELYNFNVRPICNLFIALSQFEPRYTISRRNRETVLSVEIAAPQAEQYELLKQTLALKKSASYDASIVAEELTKIVDAIDLLERLENTLTPLQNGNDDDRFFLKSKIPPILSLITSLKEDLTTIRTVENFSMNIVHRINQWWKKEQQDKKIGGDDYRCRFIQCLKEEILNLYCRSTNQPCFSLQDLGLSVREMKIPGELKEAADYFDIESAKLIKNESQENSSQNLLIIFDNFYNIHTTHTKRKFLYESIFSHCIFANTDTPNSEGNRCQLQVPLSQNQTTHVEIAFPEGVTQEQINDFSANFPRILQNASDAHTTYARDVEKINQLIRAVRWHKSFSGQTHFTNRVHRELSQAVSRHPYEVFNFAGLDQAANDLQKPGLLEQAFALPTTAQNEWEEFRRNIIKQEVLLLQSCSEPQRHKAISVTAHLKLFERREARRILFTNMGVWDYFYDSNLANKKEQAIKQLRVQLTEALNIAASSANDPDKALDDALETWKKTHLTTIQTHRTLIGTAQSRLFGKKTASEEAIEKLTQLWRESTP